VGIVRCIGVFYFPTYMPLDVYVLSCTIMLCPILFFFEKIKIGYINSGDENSSV